MFVVAAIIRYAWRAGLLAAVLPACLAPTLAAAELRIEGDRLSLTADGEPIPSVLAAFAKQGVRVKLDPGVTGTVTLSAKRQDAEAVLRAMLADWDYVALWKRVPGPLGPIPVLEELLVFRPGHKNAAQPFAGAALPISATNRVLRLECVAGELLVRVSTNASPEQFLALVAHYGGRVADSLPGLGIYKLVFPPDIDTPALARELAKNPLLASAEPNFVYRIPLPETATAAGINGGGRAIRNEAAGSRPVVAVLDTGFALADDPLVSWLDAASGSAEPVDRQGHGTQMALLAQGMMQPIGGPAVDSLLPVLAIRISDQQPFVAGDTLLKSLQAAIDQGVRVVSLSWGSDMPSAYLNELLETAMHKGIVVVAAAGNEPSGIPKYPAAFAGVVAVGAVNLDGTPASYSNFGDFLDLSAPGSAYLLSGLPGVARQAVVGTSVATAYAAHVLGLYFQAHPNATADQALAELRKAVTASKAFDWNAAYGEGILNADAVNRLLQGDTGK